jgi:hypothetical protein
MGLLNLLQKMSEHCFVDARFSGNSSRFACVVAHQDLNEKLYVRAEMRCRRGQLVGLFGEEPESGQLSESPSVSFLSESHVIPVPGRKAPRKFPSGGSPWGEPRERHSARLGEPEGRTAREV